MALDASHVLGAQQLAGVRVNPKGFLKRRAAAGAGMYAGGAVGAVVGAAAGARAGRQEQELASVSETPSFRLAYLAVTADELALIRLKTGLVGVKLAEVIERVSRSEVASGELGGGVSPALTVGFRDGGEWLLEVPRPFKRDAEEVVRMLS